MAVFRTPQSRKRALALIHTILPVVSYAVLVVWIILQHQWMFLAFIIPSALMTSAQAFSQLLHSDAEDSRTPSSSSSLSESTDESGSAWNNFLTFPTLLDGRAVSWQSIVHKLLGEHKEVSLGVCLENTAPRELTVDLFGNSPHALIAGTTGSGKSVLLQTWALHLASCYTSEELNFVFLDFKGGATFTQVAKLPHCIGSVSNLNVGEAMRAIRALEQEMMRREKLLSIAQVSDISQLENPPARIVIMADEFFILSSQLPEYVQRFTTLITLGRSLGMHCVICTQNPINQVNSHIKANMPLHICMRVTDPLQSIDMIGNASAAHFPASLAGAGVINDSETVREFRTYKISYPQQVIQSVQKAHYFMRINSPNQLFSPLLPSKLIRQSSSVSGKSAIILGYRDTGTLLEPFSLQLSRPDGIRCIALCSMNPTDALNNLTSIAHTIQSAGFTRSSRQPSHPRIAIITGSVDSATLEQLTHINGLTIFCACSSWSRLRGTLYADSQTRLDDVIIIQDCSHALSMPEIGYTVDKKTKEIAQAYTSSSPSRAIAFGAHSDLIQFFEKNFNETLEKNCILWFS